MVPSDKLKSIQLNPFFQITCAATLRPDSAEQPSDSNRISPLALHTTNIFFNNANDNQQPQPIKFGGPELRRDRYSYTQSLYSGTVIVSPLQDPPNHNFNIYEEDVQHIPDTNTFRIVSSPQPPRVWMESSFVGTKKDEQNQTPPPRTIRIIPSDTTRATTDSRFGTVPGASSSVRGGATCATQTAMGEYVLRDFRRFGITLWSKDQWIYFLKFARDQVSNSSVLGAF